MSHELSVNGILGAYNQVFLLHVLIIDKFIILEYN